MGTFRSKQFKAVGQGLQKRRCHVHDVCRGGQGKVPLELVLFSATPPTTKTHAPFTYRFKVTNGPWRRKHLCSTVGRGSEERDRQYGWQFEGTVHTPAECSKYVTATTHRPITWNPMAAEVGCPTAFLMLTSWGRALSEGSGETEQSGAAGCKARCCILGCGNMQWV